MTTIYTIGHSNMPIETFVKILAHYNIETLCDIRSFPGSRKWPWFNSEYMAGQLGTHEIEYIHIPKLGGRRKKQSQVDPFVNDAWSSSSFKNYADYTLSSAYEEGLVQLVTLATKRRVAYMCSESVPWRCHRLLVSNTLTARGFEILHIMSETKLEKHRLGNWGAPVHYKNGYVTYPSDKPMQTQLHLEE